MVDVGDDGDVADVRTGLQGHEGQSLRDLAVPLNAPPSRSASAPTIGRSAGSHGHVVEVVGAQPAQLVVVLDRRGLALDDLRGPDEHLVAVTERPRRAGQRTGDVARRAGSSRRAPRAPHGEARTAATLQGRPCRRAAPTRQRGPSGSVRRAASSRVGCSRSSTTAAPTTSSSDERGSWVGPVGPVGPVRTVGSSGLMAPPIVSHPSYRRRRRPRPPVTRSVAAGTSSAVAYRTDKHCPRCGISPPIFI